MKNWVYNLLNSFKIVFTTKRGLTKLAINSLACFGLVSGIIQFLSVLYGASIFIKYSQYILVASLVVSFFYGLIRTFPKNGLKHTFKDIDVKVSVLVGDIFKYNGQIAIGFCDTFDTDTSNNRIINEDSLQGKLLTKKFGGDLEELDRELESSLAEQIVIATEKKSDKKFGKLKRYSVGTVAVLRPNQQNKIYAVAYSNMSNALVAKSTVNDLWNALGNLWEAVYINGQRRSIALPLFGTSLSRINVLDRENLLRMSLLSFVARSREELICNEVVFYIHQKDRSYINMLELEAFIKNI